MKDFYPELCGQWISKIPQNYQQFQKQNEVLAFPLPRPTGVYKRIGNFVDQFWTQKYIDYFDNPIFTHFDCKANNVVNMPLGLMHHFSVNQNVNYMFKQNHNNQYFSKIFWKGRISTHSIRSKIISYFTSKESSQVDIKNWNIDCSKYGIYGQRHLQPPPKTEYTSYFNELKNSDFFLVIRGDKPWTLSFMDSLRAGAIPVCIDTFYQDMGWENINIQPEDLFLYFSTETYSVEEIYDECLKVLQDKDRVLYMKNNINQFYKKYILTDRAVKNKYHIQCWSDFIAAKILEIQRNDYKIADNKFISPLVNEIKKL